MRAPETRQDEAALERLREHEAALSHRLDATRAEAERVRAEALAAAEAIRQESAARIAQEVAAATQLATRQLELELAALREASNAEVQATLALPPARRDEAVRHLVALASGGVP